MKKTIKTLQEWWGILEKSPLTDEDMKRFLEALKDHPMWLNERNAENHPVLWVMAQKNISAWIRPWIDMGGDVHVQNERGSQALLGAAMNNHKEVLGALIEAGADVNHQNDHGSSALMAASVKGHAAMVIELIKAGADVNLQDQFGKTALMKALLFERTEVVHQLLQAGSNVHLRNKRGESVMDWVNHGNVSNSRSKGLITAWVQLESLSNAMNEGQSEVKVNPNGNEKVKQQEHVRRL